MLRTALHDADAMTMADRFYDLWWVDVFTDVPFAGNALAVFPRAQGLADAEMAAIAREMNISETTFVLPPRDHAANYRNRIFTPGGEIPFAGHPSIGTAYVAALEGIVPHPEGTSVIHQEIGIGVLPIELRTEGGTLRKVIMTQGEPSLGKRMSQVDGLAKALGIKARDMTATGLRPQVASTGALSLQIPVRSIDVVHDLEPQPAALARILRRFGPETGSYVFSFETEGGADLHARGFFPLHGVGEDPATGSAAGACGAYLAANGRLPAKDWFVIEQGIEIQHPGRIEVGVHAEGTVPKVVRVGGQVAPVLRGSLRLG